MTTETRIANLEAQINRLEARESELREQLAKAQLDQWYARIEDLELQAHLGVMETNDRLKGLVRQVRDAWSEAKVQVEATTSTAFDAIESARGRIEGLLGDVRHGVAEARDKVWSS